MFAKRFLYVCAGLFLLTRAASAAPLWVCEYDESTIMSLGPYATDLSPIAPSALLFGTMPNFASVGHMAMLQVVIGPGESVPLPVYSDGSSATENEIFWTAQLWQANWTTMLCGFPRKYTSSDRCDVTFDGRILAGTHCVIDNTAQCLGQYGWHTNDVKVLVNVVAFRPEIPTSVVGDDGEPLGLRIGPNPTGSGATISFRLDRSGPVALGIYDARGRLVRRLQSGPMLPGDQQVRWDGRDRRGRSVESGVYFARLETVHERRTAKIVRTN